MKRYLAIITFAALCTIGVRLVAQTTPDASQSGTSSTTAADASAPKEHSMTGCLQKGADAGTFKLTDLEKGPKTVEIAEATAKLDPHVGHKVEITGTAMVGKDPKAHTMKVSGVKMISATCP